MNQPIIIYVAINKKFSYVMVGAKGQYAFGNVPSLKRSMGQSYRYQAEREGVSPKDMYDVYKVNLNDMTKEVVQ